MRTKIKFKAEGQEFAKSLRSFKHFYSNSEKSEQFSKENAF